MTRSSPDIVERLRNFAVWNARQSHYEPVPLTQEAAAEIERLRRSSAATEEDWRDDPASDERWNAGLDFAMEHLCKFLGVNPREVNWDAATETLDGDVLAVIGNVLRAKFGDDWGPDDPAQPQPELPLSGEGTRCFLCQGDTNPDQYGEMQMIKQHVEQPEATEPMGICDCGFTADECGTNHCMRKKIHLAGMTPGSKWPEGAPISKDFKTTGNGTERPHHQT